MKQFKRLLALGLAFALAIGLALPTMAAVDWDDFRITKQPQGLTIKQGDSFTLSVEANIPDGVEVEYQWYREGGAWGELAIKIVDATTPDLHQNPNDSDYPDANMYHEYHCMITAYENGNAASTRTLTSSRVRVLAEEEKKEKTFWEKVYSVTLEPFAYAGIMTMSGLLMSMGLIIPLSPFYFLYFLVEGYVKGFKGLF